MHTESITQLDQLAPLSDCKSKIYSWLTDSSIENQDKFEIVELIKNKNISELRDRFYKNIEFGTGGMRGIMGQGFNRINKYIVGRVCQGFSNYILKCDLKAKQKGIAIAYDSRHNSKLFALKAAQVLCANGIKAYVFPTLQTTPALSYAIRKLNCTGGLCFTASHNPKEYNGIKVYWDDGAQIVSPQDKGILKEVFEVTSFSQTKLITLEEAEKLKLFQIISDDILDSYYNEMKNLSLKKNTDNLKIIYTPLHGTGKIPALRALNSWGFNNVFVVPEQGEPDGNFPSVNKPNPEEKEALTLAIQYANQQKADLVFATDPDSDRLALAVYHPEYANGILKHQSLNNYVLLNGNQTGSLLIDYILSQKKEDGSLTPAHKIIKTIVTSDLQSDICKNYDVEIFNTLTGFKWIAALERTWEESKKNYDYLFGTEESYGYMAGRFVRDKDGISALCLATEMASYLKQKNSNLCEYLFTLFKKYGAWQEDLINVDLYGEEGMKRIEYLMSKMRKNPIMSWNNIKVTEIRDYTLPKTQALYHIPPSNVIQFYLEDGSKISMRPSGTEPKLKYYISVCTKSDDVEFAYHQTLEKVGEIKKKLLDFSQEI